jgi:hypothetical protein
VTWHGIFVRFEFFILGSGELTVKKYVTHTRPAKKSVFRC